LIGDFEIDRRALCAGSLAVAGLAGAGVSFAAEETNLAASFPALPYGDDALAPVISSETVAYHYGKHHKGYYDAVMKAVANSDLAALTLEQIIRKSAGDATQAALFNPAGQLWNHNFYWTSMRPKGGGKPGGSVAARIDDSFGGYDAFRKEFAGAATKLFGSGWVWLVEQPSGKLAVVATGNADSPMAHGVKCLLTCDVWEHAYYIDHRNRRADYANAWLDQLVNWDFASQKLAGG
jgi:Fe-Mn family superoxide dismutase